MRKLITLCAILLFSAFVVSAQTTKDPVKANGPQKSVQTNKSVVASRPGAKGPEIVTQKTVIAVNPNAAVKTDQKKAQDNSATKAAPQKRDVRMEKPAAAAVMTANTATKPVSVQNSSKLGLHGPDTHDPDFAAKKAEWIKNYPDEYNALLNQSQNK